MEPMTLGSPVTSPTSPPHFGGSHHTHPSGIGTPSQHNGFLPNYLMGDYSQQGSGLLMSPTKNRSVVASPAAPITATPKPTIGFLTPNTSVGLRTPSTDKPMGGGGGGPPVTGLFSTPKQRLQPRLGGTPAAAGTPILAGGGGTPMPSTPHLSFGGTPSAVPASLNRLVNMSQRESENSTWVTVFGFPPSAASYILSQFSQCGTILQHKVPTNGNWMHIKYQTRMQAQKALGRSGRVFGGTLMVGVVSCSESSVGDTSNLDASVMGGVTHAPSFMESCHPNETTIQTINSSLNTTKPIRSLTQSYKVAQNDLNVSNISNAPSRNEGLVSKAMEYIFGW